MNMDTAPLVNGTFLPKNEARSKNNAQQPHAMKKY